MADDKTTPDPTPTPAADTPPPSDDAEFVVIDGKDGLTPEEPKDAAPEGDKAKAEPKVDAKADKDPEEDEANLPDWIKKRVARSNRRRDEEKARADDLDAKLKEATTLAEKALAKLGLKAPDAAKFDSYEEFQKAKAKYDEAMAEKLEPPKKAEPSAPTEADEALADVKEAVEAKDPALWEKAVEMANAKAASGEPIFFTDTMMIEVADADDPVGIFKAIIDMSDDERRDLADMSRRAFRRAVREMKVAPPPPPAKDPETGKFVKRQSAAPAPIEPVRTPTGGPRPTTDPNLSTDEFIERRNKEEAQGNARFGW